MREKLVEEIRKTGYVTPKEAAEISGLTKATVYRWMEAGFVAHQRIGPALFVELASLKARCPDDVPVRRESRGALNEEMRAGGFVPPKDAAEIAGISVKTIYKWMNTGVVTCKVVGAARFVSLASLAAHFEIEPQPR